MTFDHPFINLMFQFVSTKNTRKQKSDKIEMRTEPLNIKTTCGHENKNNHHCAVIYSNEEIDPLRVAVFTTKNGAQCCNKKMTRNMYSSSRLTTKVKTTLL